MITSWDSGLPRTVTLLESGDHEVSQEFVICVKESEFLVIVFLLHKNSGVFSDTVSGETSPTLVHRA